MRNIILLAPPAAGKGTQSEILEKEYHLAHISTGDLLREFIKKEDELSEEIKQVIARGEFVRDELMCKIIEHRLTSPDCKDGYILDGFPRNVEQAKKYEVILEKLNFPLGYVFFLKVDKDILEKRITGRRICENCGAVFNVNIEGSMPKESGFCDKCHGNLYQRDDDNQESFEVRYQTYLQKTEPLIAYYKDKGVLYEVDGSQDKVKTFQEIKLILDREMI